MVRLYTGDIADAHVDTVESKHSSKKSKRSTISPIKTHKKDPSEKVSQDKHSVFGRLWLSSKNFLNQLVRVVSHVPRLMLFIGIVLLFVVVHLSAVQQARPGDFLFTEKRIFERFQFMIRTSASSDFTLHSSIVEDRVNGLRRSLEENNCIAAHLSASAVQQELRAWYARARSIETVDTDHFDHIIRSFASMPVTSCVFPSFWHEAEQVLTVITSTQNTENISGRINSDIRTNIDTLTELQTEFRSLRISSQEAVNRIQDALVRADRQLTYATEMFNSDTFQQAQEAVYDASLSLRYAEELIGDIQEDNDLIPQFLMYRDSIRMACVMIPHELCDTNRLQSIWNSIEAQDSFEQEAQAGARVFFDIIHTAIL